MHSLHFSLTWSSNYEKWCITRKSPLIILTCWILNMSRGLKIHKAEKGNRDYSRHGKWENPENGRVGKWATRDAKEDCPNDENRDELDEKERDY